MKYRLTPLHFLAGLTLGQFIYFSIDLAFEKGNPGLGGLLPHFLFGMTMGILVLDLIIQLWLGTKKKSLYITETILGLAALIWYIKIGRV
jgi:hypothetical protein